MFARNHTYVIPSASAQGTSSTVLVGSSLVRCRSLGMTYFSINEHTR